MRKKIIAANWKMYKTPKEALAFLSEFLPQVKGHDRDQIVFFPTATALAYVIDALRGTGIGAGAQTMHWLSEGPYTGQTSPTMLVSLGASYVLLGHSERRLYANETYEHVNLKLKAAVHNGLTPILCLGEMVTDRQEGYTADTLMAQMGAALANFPIDKANRLVLAYEPVWAIGTGKTATPEIANEAHAIIRADLRSRFGAEIADGIRILYGGSVKPNNTAALMECPDIDGALIGGASLDPISLAQIVRYGMPTD
jgi:triosephosphate isomerase